MQLLITLTNEKMHFNLTHESREQPNIVFKEWQTKLGKATNRRKFLTSFPFLTGNCHYDVINTGNSCSAFC